VGETTVSKRLLEKALGDKAVKGFRVPGYAYPPALDEALELGGYSYDSSLVANNCLTNFPFRLVRHRALTAESPVVEFPVTFADELAEGALPDAAAMLKTARRISAYGGAVVWEIHPNGQAGQRERLEAVLSGAPPGTHWMSMSEAARFWNRRAAARFSFVSSGAKRLRLKISAPEGVGGLSFQLSGRAKNCSSKIGAVCRGDILLIPSSVQAKEAEVTVNFE
jgi:hypothetical protein